MVTMLASKAAPRRLSGSTRAAVATRVLLPADISRVVEMAWEDRTPYEAIAAQFGLNESAVVALMRQQLKPGSFRLWRQRMRGRVTKHATLRPAAMEHGGRHQASHRIPQR